MRNSVLKSGTHWFFIFLFICGCGGGIPKPDQAEMENLDFLEQQNAAFVRLYGSYWFFQDSKAIHTWFLVKSDNSTQVDRWEVTPFYNEDNGYVGKNVLAPLFDFGGGDFLIAELTGPEAQSVLDFIQTQSAYYPAKNVFRLLVGPNCNTYSQWVLDHTKWNITLPSIAIGKDAPLISSP
jgi:hypothetical protein